MARPLALLPCLVAFLAVSCGDDDDDEGASWGDPKAAAEPEQEQGGCREVDEPAPRPDGGAKKPSGRLDTGKTYRVVLSTSCGEIAIRLDQKTSPKTTASFASITRQRFYDDTALHRIVPGFVIQGGDPTRHPKGRPGLRRPREAARGHRVRRGCCGHGQGPRRAARHVGSQFFIVTAQVGADLPPEYAPLGEVVEGMDARAIEALGDDTGIPLQTGVIEKANLDVS